MRRHRRLSRDTVPAWLRGGGRIPRRAHHCGGESHERMKEASTGLRWPESWLCAVCWLLLLVVMPFVPDLDVKAGCKHL
jgi:hypothetical protein